jgi:hypothetical protein
VEGRFWRRFRIGLLICLLPLAFAFANISGVHTGPAPQPLLQQIARINRREPGKLYIMSQRPEGLDCNLQAHVNGKPAGAVRSTRPGETGGATITFARSIISVCSASHPDAASGIVQIIDEIVQAETALG